MKPKVNHAGSLVAAKPFDLCQTPPYALSPLLAHLQSDWLIWECAAGEGNLSNALSDYGYHVIATDIIAGQNFFDECQPGLPWDVIVTNPPYSIKYDWLERCYSFGMPFALLMPVEMMAAAKAQRLLSRYGFELILLDKRVNFKMPNLGYNGHGAQFPVAWYSWGLGIGQQVTFARIDRAGGER